MVVSEPELVLRQLVLPGQRGLEHGRIVSVQRDHHATVKKVLDRMIADAGAEFCPQIAGDANLHRDLFFREHFREFRIVGNRQSVAYSLRANIERGPDGLGASRFSGVRREPKTVAGGLFEEIFEPFGGAGKSLRKLCPQKVVPP